MLSTRDSLQIERRTRLKVKEYEKAFHKNEKKNKAGVVTLTPDKIDFKSKAI